MTTRDLCPCGLPVPYPECCGRFHRGDQAPTAQLLMRSRFAAFAVADEAYLSRTWHPDTRPRGVRLDPAQQWLELHLLSTTRGGLFDQVGTVEFRAHYRLGGRVGVIHENSHFVRHNGQWRYVGPVSDRA